MPCMPPLPASAARGPALTLPYARRRPPATPPASPARRPSRRPARSRPPRPLWPRPPTPPRWPPRRPRPQARAPGPRRRTARFPGSGVARAAVCRRRSEPEERSACFAAQAAGQAARPGCGRGRRSALSRAAAASAGSASGAGIAAAAMAAAEQAAAAARAALAVGNYAAARRALPACMRSVHLFYQGHSRSDGVELEMYA